SVDVLLDQQFQITADVVDQFGNTVADGTPVSWEIVPANNYVTIEISDGTTTDGQATIDLKIEQNAPWEFDFVVELTSESITGATGTHNIHDVTAPEAVSNLAVSPDVWTSVNDFTLTWSNPSEHAGVAGAHYSIDGSGDSFVEGQDITSLTELSLPDNAVSTFDVWLEDNAGNDDSGNLISVTAKWDDTPPEGFSVTAPINTWYNSINLRFEWNASSDATAGLQYYKLDVDEGNIYQLHPDSTGMDFPIGFAQGTHTWTISAVDSAGNETITSNPQTFYVDYFEPEISHNPVLEANENSPMTITATFSDDGSGIAIAQLYYRKGGEAQWQAPIDMSTLNTYQIASSFVTSVGVEYYVYAQDVAGNETYKPSTGYYSSSVTIPNPGLSSTDRWPTGIDNGSAVSSYQLISFPAQAFNATPNDILITSSAFPAYDNTVWRFFEYGGSSLWNEFASISSIDPGVGYFLIVKDPALNLST
ncbi:MAG: hypothetical protein QGF69_07910, partial [Candidatus Marinimicrobia bacterium]|nr:hypothetical protein [Candidatus Neomarinimicrobiota bacterium]